jgi:protein-L-isoaspartate(D-aspartate) O-methyltransferase
MNMSLNYDMARQQMLDAHLKQRGIRSSAVLGAMARVPREAFVPESESGLAYADQALAIDCAQTISQPYIVALMTEALAVSRDDRVLEIGTGSGYQTAVLAELAGEVYSVERHAPLSQQAAERLARLGYQNVHLRVGDGSLGWPEAGPYQRIMITAAGSEVPTALWEQLAEGGVLVAPLGDAEEQVLYAIHKVGGRSERQVLTRCRFVPLVAGEGAGD